MSKTYRVIAPGFHGGKLYDPAGKRQILTVDKPFKKGKLPSWLAEMPSESKAVREKREAQEASQTATDQEQHQEQQQDIENASFLGEGESSSSIVETL